MEFIRIEEASQFCGVPHEIIMTFIEEEWISPRDLNNLDDEDLARIRLIWELQSEFGVNDEAMPIILNLLDQLYRMHLELEKIQIH
jgi:chaperone modulatory protein CbpM